MTRRFGTLVPFRVGTSTEGNGAMEPHVSENYEVGAILEYSWGYDQTNIDFFVIVKRTESPKATWLTLLPIKYGTNTETAWLQGNCTPGEVVTTAKPIRRKLHKWDGQEHGVAIRSYGWCSLWDGKPAHWTAYA